MFYIAMKQSITANCKCNGYHAPFKKKIVDDVYTKQWKACHQKRQQCTMYGAGYRCCNPNDVPVKFSFHLKKRKYSIFAMLLQVLKLAFFAKIVKAGSFLPVALQEISDDEK